VVNSGPETDELSEKVKQYSTYISGDKDPKYPEHFFNTTFLVSPRGNIIHKYRKMNP
jgi:predicted amidohydrolase